MSSYEDALYEFYSGEVIGEAAYSGVLSTASSSEQRLKIATLLQLETETKAWLRSHMLARNVSIEEQAGDRSKGEGYAAAFRKLSWREMVQTLHDVISAEFLPRYESFADSAKGRGNAAEEAVCRHMVEHEKAQIEFAKRELAGASLQHALEPIVRHLKYALTL
jgi:hypothetical protein